MEGPGTITWEEFLNDAEKFLQVSNNISDCWEIRGDKKEPGQAYLFHEEKIFISSDKVSMLNSKTDEIYKNYENVIDPFEAPSCNDSPLIIQHHILWSLSYSVPVLYFNGWLSGKTFLYLHPCMSKELLQITPKSENKLISWLSAFAPAALNLKLKNEYFELTRGNQVKDKFKKPT
ncbi:uncharacterized protein LOC122858172 isoform X3 [Aphidius gifuensis]|uniref:uncharacterized protein LOC122858172 isoform X3 n=1 Tax=Aphidius gifuensis TaxID=684658 RepID=UPI001CDC1461|nr:uncharacterized protein LOC122858172 isoform X3 [Aphidius gifuensis]